MRRLRPKVLAARGGWQVIFHSPAEEAKATAKIIKKSLGKAELVYSRSISNPALPPFGKFDLKSGERYWQVVLKESPLLAEGVPLVPYAMQRCSCKFKLSCNDQELYSPNDLLSSCIICCINDPC